MSSSIYSISLTAIAFLTGVAILPVFARFSDSQGLLLAKRKIRAALYAFRLFGDEPRLVFRAQGQLLLWNARYLALVLKPAAIVLLPILFLLLQLDVIYGHRALHVGESAIVTARISDSVNLSATAPTLTATGATVETPPVRIQALHRIFWRVRATRTGDDTLQLQLADDGETCIMRKELQAGTGLRYLSMRRVTSFMDWLHYPAERRLAVKDHLRWMQVGYPETDIDIFGLKISWIVWFVIVSWAAMFALRKRFGVIL